MLVALPRQHSHGTQSVIINFQLTSLLIYRPYKVELPFNYLLVFTFIQPNTFHVYMDI